MAKKGRNFRGIKRLERIVSIIIEFFAGKCLRKAELANAYRVCEKTIQRDLGTIQNCLAELAAQRNIFLLLDYDTKGKWYCMRGMARREENIELYSKEETQVICRAVLASGDLSEEEKRRILKKVVCNCVQEVREKIWKWILGELS